MLYTTGAAAPPSTSLGPWADSAVAWSTWSGGYDYPAAWDSLYDASVAGLAPLAFGAAAAGRARNWLLGTGLAAGAVPLAVSKFPGNSGGDWGKTITETVMWMMHLFGGAIWIGGLAGLLLLALPGAVAREDRGAFWAAANQAYQAQPSVYQSAPGGSLPKIPAKQASASTWIWGTCETIAAAAVMTVGYRASGRLSRRRALAGLTLAARDTGDVLGAQGSLPGQPRHARPK